MTARAISRRTTIPLRIIEKGISELLKPDPESRTPTEGGRRIVPLVPDRDWGWLIVNFVEYHKIRTESDRSEYHRQYYQTVTKPKRVEKVEKVEKLNSSDSIHVDVDVDVDVDTDVDPKSKATTSASPPPVAETEQLPVQNNRPAQQAIPGVDARARKRAAGAADRFDAAQFLVDQGAESQTAADYLTLRKGKRAVATRTALQGIVREISKSGLSIQEGIELCCNRGWAGFKAEWADVQQSRDGPRQSRYDQCKATLDELTGRTRHDPKTERDITAEVFRIA
jgi:hypothetical protein